MIRKISRMNAGDNIENRKRREIMLHNYLASWEQLLNTFF